MGVDRAHGVSVDLFGELVRDPATADRVVTDYQSLATALQASADAWASVDLTHLALDAARTDAVLGCVLDVASRGLSTSLGATVQANLLRSPADADALAAAGVHIRLVKGAYVEATGAHPYGEPTDIAYMQLAFRLAEAGATWSMATHDGRIREALLLALGPVPVEQLLGVRPEVLDDLRDRKVPTRVYVPYGPDWFRYWLRRLAESRGA
jgi:proline dehydrogenase